MNNNFDISLRPHHIKAYLNFEKEKLYELTVQEYFEQFRNKNKFYHNSDFIEYWRKLLLELHNNNKIRFLYNNGPDTVCENCDVRDECEDVKTKLHKIITILDCINRKELGLIEGNIYSVEEIMKEIKRG